MDIAVRSHRAGLSRNSVARLTDHMPHNFELDTLKIRIADPKLAPLELRVRACAARSFWTVTHKPVPPASPRTARTKSAKSPHDTRSDDLSSVQLDGYIVRREGSGSFVSRRSGPVCGISTKELTTMDCRPVRMFSALSAGDHEYSSRRPAIADQQEVGAFTVPSTGNRFSRIDISGSATSGLGLSPPAPYYMATPFFN